MMICIPCKMAADQGQFGAENHIFCLGKTWCDCQHKESVKDASRPSQPRDEETQSPQTS
jgi:hypothetical protein